MFLITMGSLLKCVAAECWKVPDFLGIENIGAVDDLKYYYKQLLDADSVSDTQESYLCPIVIYE